MGNNQELWRGQNNKNIRSRFFGDRYNGNNQENTASYNHHDQKVADKLEQKHRHHQETKTSPQERAEARAKKIIYQRVDRADKDIKGHANDIMKQSIADTDSAQAYVARIAFFEEQIRSMAEKPRGQVEKLARTIVREFALEERSETATAHGSTVVNPETFITTSAKELLKLAPTEILLLTPFLMANWVLKHSPKEVKAKIKQGYDTIPAKWRLAFVLIIATGLLAACSAAGTPDSQTPTGGDTGPTAGETTSTPSESATDNPAETANLSPEEQRIQDIKLKTETDLDASFNTDPFMRQINIDGNLPKEIWPLCGEFATKLDAGRPDQGSYIDVFSGGNIFGVSVIDGDPFCHVTTSDGTVIVDAWDNDGPLYLTPAVASQALGVEVARVSADGRHGSIGDAYDADGRRVGGVSRYLLQWEPVNEDGILPSEADPSSVPPTPVNTEQSNLYQVNYAPAIDEEAKAQAMANLAIGYENGDVTAEEIDKMSFEKRKEFSIALAKEKNKQRGINPIVYNNEAYVDPVTGKMKSTEDGSTKEQQTIEMYVPIVTDGEGYVHVMNKAGKWIKIKNSKGVNFQIFDNFEDASNEITMPTTEKLGGEAGDLAGMTVPESALKRADHPAVMMPIILNNKDLGEIYLSGGGKIPTQEMLVQENAYVARKIKVSASNMRLFKEGSDLDMRSSGLLQTNYDIFEAMEENAVYYLIFFKNHERMFNSTFPVIGDNEVTSEYSGFVSSNLILDILSGKNNDPKNFIWINVRMLIQADSQTN